MQFFASLRLCVFAREICSTKHGRFVPCRSLCPLCLCGEPRPSRPHGSLMSSPVTPLLPAPRFATIRAPFAAAVPLREVRYCGGTPLLPLPPVYPLLCALCSSVVSSAFNLPGPPQTTANPSPRPSAPPTPLQLCVEPLPAYPPFPVSRWMPPSLSSPLCALAPLASSC